MKVPGYNFPRPKSEDYDKFLEEFSEELQSLKGVGLMIYGSFGTENFVPGRSDLDAMLIFPDDVVIDKNVIEYVAAAIKKSMEGRNISFQISPQDATTLKDGRFNSFSGHFGRYFQDEGRVVVGPDYRPSMTFLERKTGEETNLAHNLRKVRSHLLFSRHNLEEDRSVLVYNFYYTLSAVKRTPIDILHLAGSKPEKSKTSLDRLKETFPDLDTCPLEEIDVLFKDPTALDGIYGSDLGIMTCMNSSITFFEELIRKYIKKIPFNSEEKK